MPDMLPLFVFGTLRMGECNHHLLEGRYDRVLLAVLPGFALVAPLMIARSPAHRVPGELFFLSGKRYREALSGCDRLEGLPPGRLIGREYRRMQVRVQTEEGFHNAWAYPRFDTE